MRALIILALVTPLAACDWLDAWAGKSTDPAPAYAIKAVGVDTVVELAPAVETPVSVEVAQVEAVPPPEPPPEPVIEPEPAPEPAPEPVAVEVCEPYEWRGQIVPNCHWEWH